MAKAYLLGIFKLENDKLVLEEVFYAGSSYVTQDLSKIILVLVEGTDDLYSKSKEHITKVVNEQARYIDIWKWIKDRIPKETDNV